MTISKTKRAKLKICTPNNCWYCGVENPSTIDHVVPISHGGGDNLDNLALCCRKCNSSKRDLSVKCFRFRCAWNETDYSAIIGSLDASRLMSLGVSFGDFEDSHKFWFEDFL